MRYRNLNSQLGDLSNSLPFSLAEIAGAQNIIIFEDQALTGNQQMIKVLSRSRFPVRQRIEAGVFNLILRLAPQNDL